MIAFTVAGIDPLHLRERRTWVLKTEQHRREASDMLVASLLDARDQQACRGHEPHTRYDTSLKTPRSNS